MKCSRCSGAIIPERFYGYEATFEGWKCIACGEVFDEVVLQNRHDLLKLAATPRRRSRSTRSMGR